jgi:hypothetical protein
VTYFQAGHPPTPQKETTMATIPATGNTDNTKPDFVDQLLDHKEFIRTLEMLAPDHSYMRHAHLLPPLEYFETVDWYVQVLKLFEKAIRRTEGFYQFNPTPRQLVLNGKRLMKWEASQRKPRSGDDDRRKRALGLLDWRCRALAEVGEGSRDDQTNAALRYLSPLVNEGWLTRADLADAIIDASHRNGHIPGNKSCRAVEYDIDRALTKFSEPFGWERLDNDAR